MSTEVETNFTFASATPSIIVSWRRFCWRRRNKKQCVTVTGTPGIGKSVFYAYFCEQFHKAHPDVYIISASFDVEVNAIAVFKPEAEPQYHSKRGELEDIILRVSTEAEENGANLLYLCDGPPDVRRQDGQMVVFTSPNEKWLRRVEKDYCTYYMPLWTLDELQEAAVDLGFSPSDSTIEERFETFGGEARHCLSSDSSIVEEGIENMHGAIKAITSTDELRNLLSKNENSETRHRLLHYVPKENGKKGHTELASPLVIELLSERIRKLTNNNRTNMRLIFSPIEEANGLLGHIFEIDAHTPLI